MPGPPPPSPSYNLVLDTSSDEETTTTTTMMGDVGFSPEDTAMRIRNSAVEPKKISIEDDAGDGIRIRNGPILEDDAMRIRNSSKARNNNDVVLSMSEVDLKSLRCDDANDPIDDDADDEEDSFGDGGGGGVDVASAVVETFGQSVFSATGNGIGGGNASKKKKKKKGKTKKSKKKKKKVVPLVEAEETVAEDDVPSAAVLPAAAGISAAAPDASNAVNNHKAAGATVVTFGKMSVREYKRCMGTDVVPVDGGWPLGLSYDVANEYDVTGGVDAFEERKQNELRRRYVEIMTNKIRKLHKYKKEQQEHGHGSRHHNRRQRGKSIASEDDLTAATDEEKKESAAASGQEAKIHIPVPESVLETRQYDYKSKRSIDVKTLLRSEEHDIDVLDDGRNPLFGALCEDERHKLLLRDTESTSSSTSPVDKDDSSGKDSNHGGHKQHNSKNCNSKHSANNNNNKSHHQQQQQQRKKQRSNSNADQHQNYICPSANEVVYNTTEIKHVRNELEQIRNHRTGEGSSGCTCRKLHVHLPNHNTTGGNGSGGGSKRNSHRRMPERRVKDELRKRHMLKSGTKKLSRDEMERMLYDAVESEPCCWGTDCPCVRDGINCQLDSCSCWHPSHNDTHSSNRSSSSSSTSSGNSNDDATKKKAEGTGNIGKGGASEQGGNDLIKRRCGNKFGMYAVDFEHIGQYRSQFLTNSKNSVALKADDK